MWSTAKIAGTAIIFGLSYICSLLPCVLVRCLRQTLGTSSKFNRAISLLNCFAGGVFFATSFLDLLPEARESMESVLQARGIDTEFALTECLMGVGFLVILFLEQFALRCCSNVHETDLQSHSVDDSEIGHSTGPVKTLGYHKTGESPKTDYTSIDDVHFVQPSSHSQQQNKNSNISYGTIDNATNILPQTGANSKQTVGKSNHTISHISKSGEGNTLAESTALQPKNTGQTKKLRSLILLGALSLHMIFDGLALGLLQDETDIWQLTLALSIHKSLVFFTIGLQLLELFNSVGKVILAGLFFSLISPLGILIGELLTDGNDITKDTVSAVLQSFATGTFIFVTFFEILQKELNVGDHDLLKVFSTCVGFALVAVIKLFTHED